MMEMFAFGEPLDITTRHPSPWHQLSHSLSPSTLPSLSPSPRRTSSNGSLALATWEQQLAEGCGDVQRSQLVLGPGSGFDDASNTNTSDGEVLRTPKLEAERDQEGHIEYKLKLIDPSPERFERLVTQMKWRLSQGGNEAIYEVGLHDDGSVIGLTRPEMDASLRTLELMASELGATVMILQEIVIVSPAASSPRRTDLYADGLPKRGTKAIVGHDVLGHVVLPRVKAKKRIDDPNRGYSKRLDKEAKFLEKSRRKAAIAEARRDDISPFELDFESGDPAETSPISHGWIPPKPHRQATSPKTAVKAMAAPPSPAKTKKNDARRQRAQARRERRYADLLAGDGCNVDVDADDSWLGLVEYATNKDSIDALTSANLHALTHARAGLHSLSLNEADPNRASSLRLAVSPVGSPPADEIELLTAPLDSLSLSFADVRTVTGEDTKSVSSSDGPLASEEMICVEALVVRKAQQEDYVDFDWYHEAGSEVRASEMDSEDGE